MHCRRRTAGCSRPVRNKRHPKDYPRPPSPRIRTPQSDRYTGTSRDRTPRVCASARDCLPLARSRTSNCRSARPRRRTRLTRDLRRKEPTTAVLGLVSCRRRERRIAVKWQIASTRSTDGVARRSGQFQPVCAQVVRAMRHLSARPGTCRPLMLREALRTPVEPSSRGRRRGRGRPRRRVPSDRRARPAADPGPDTWSGPGVHSCDRRSGHGAPRRRAAARLPRYTTPWAVIASATRRKPAMLAPRT